MEARDDDPLSTDPLGAPAERGDATGARRKRTFLWVALAIAGFGTLVLFVCGGGLYLLTNAGLELIEEETRAQLEELPAVERYLGEILVVDLEVLRSMDEESEQIYFFRVEGTKASGRLEAEYDEDVEELVRATLELESGELVELVE